MDSDGVLGPVVAVADVVASGFSAQSILEFENSLFVGLLVVRKRSWIPIKHRGVDDGLSREGRGLV